jgi:hypothetical protein
MKDIIKRTLDEYSKNYKQINLDSEASRVMLSEQIAERIESWQKQKDQVGTKRKKD